MEKVLKVDLLNSKVLVSNEETRTLNEYDLTDFSFSPQVGDFVTVYKNADRVYITKSDAGLNTGNQQNTSYNNYQSQTAYNSQFPGAYRSVNKIVYILLALFLGGFGIHKFIVGKVAVGILYLILSTLGLLILIGPLIVFVLVIIDIVKVASLPADLSDNARVKATGFFEN